MLNVTFLIICFNIWLRSLSSMIFASAHEYFTIFVNFSRKFKEIFWNFYFKLCSTVYILCNQHFYRIMFTKLYSMFWLTLSEIRCLFAIKNQDFFLSTSCSLRFAPFSAAIIVLKIIKKKIPGLGSNLFWSMKHETNIFFFRPCIARYWPLKDISVQICPDRAID